MINRLGIVPYEAVGARTKSRGTGSVLLLARKSARVAGEVGDYVIFIACMIMELLHLNDEVRMRYQAYKNRSRHFDLIQ